ncbi:hypothetical protein [Chitinophaga sp. HK235]|uniref:hypothetical protein n=1 Tax=Chitinophaga sp. HK235 TaxID=2952571 RepID=UPI001BAB0B52|nr:hypothetical protein [Chitinophaga sp. HK235]
MIPRINEGSVFEYNNGIVSARETTSYNDRGKFLERINYHPDGTVDQWWSWQFNELNCIIEWNYHHPDGSLNYQETATYNEARQQTEFIGRDRRQTTAYDEQGREVTFGLYLPDGSLNYIRERVYDDSGNMIQEKWIWGIHKKTDITTYTYNELNQCIEEKGDPGNFMITSRRMVFIYNEEGLIKEEIEFTAAGEFVGRYFYEYNEFGEIITERYAEE